MRVWRVVTPGCWAVEMAAASIARVTGFLGFSAQSTPVAVLSSQGGPNNCFQAPHELAAVAAVSCRRWTTSRQPGDCCHAQVWEDTKHMQACCIDRTDVKSRPTSTPQGMCSNRDRILAPSPQPESSPDSAAHMRRCQPTGACTMTTRPQPSSLSTQPQQQHPVVPPIKQPK